MTAITETIKPWLFKDNSSLSFFFVSQVFSELPDVNSIKAERVGASGSQNGGHRVCVYECLLMACRVEVGNSQGQSVNFNIRAYKLFRKRDGKLNIS